MNDKLKENIYFSGSDEIDEKKSSHISEELTSSTGFIDFFYFYQEQKDTSRQHTELNSVLTSSYHKPVN